MFLQPNLASWPQNPSKSMGPERRCYGCLGPLPQASPSPCAHPHPQRPQVHLLPSLATLLTVLHDHVCCSLSLNRALPIILHRSQSSHIVDTSTRQERARPRRLRPCGYDLLCHLFMNKALPVTLLFPPRFLLLRVAPALRSTRLPSSHRYETDPCM